MAVPPVINNTPDPNVAFNNYVLAWQQQEQQQGQDITNLANAITTMMAMMKSGNVQEAFQFAGMAVMPQSMQCVGDNTGQFAGVENLGTGIRNIVGDLQNIFNEGSNIDNSSNPHSAADFAQWINEFYSNMNQGCPSWMDPSDYSNIMNNLNSIYTEFNPSGGKGNLQAATVSAQMKAWFTNSGNAPNKAITAMQGNFQTLNNSVSAISSSATASEQYWTNVYNQAQGVTNNIFQSIASLNTNSVANEKTN